MRFRRTTGMRARSLPLCISQFAGSLAPFDRFAEADTAIRVFGSDRSLAYWTRRVGVQPAPPL